MSDSGDTQIDTGTAATPATPVIPATPVNPTPPALSSPVTAPCSCSPSVEPSGPVLVQLPSIADLSAAMQATPQQVQARLTNTVVGMVDDLVSGKNPLSSKTLIVNGILIFSGVFGMIWSAWISGDGPTLAASMVSLGTGSINAVLRCVTTGPIMTKGMQKLMGSYASALGDTLNQQKPGQ